MTTDNTSDTHEKDGTSRDARRLAELTGLSILDTPPDESFDRIVRLAAMIFGVPTVLLSFIDHDRQWLKARIGFERCEMSRDTALCQRTLESESVFVIENGAQDCSVLAAELPDYPAIGFFAGRRIHGPAGHAVGALYLIAPGPRVFSPREADILIELARLAENELRRRTLARHGMTPEPGGTWIPARASTLSGDTRYAPVDRLLEVAAKSGRRLALSYLRINNLAEFHLLYEAPQATQFIEGWLDQLATTAPGLRHIGQLSETTLAAVLEYDGTLHEAQQLCDALRRQAIRPADVLGITFSFNISAGASLFPDHATTAIELIGKARLAHATRHIDDMTALYTPTIGQRSQRHSRLLARFEDALADGSIYFHWQPIFGHGGRALVAFELLARWYDAEFGAISPNEFIPLIDRRERLRRALVITALDTACNQLACWREKGIEPPHVSLNIPGSEFYREDFVALVTRALARHGVGGNHLIFELTERSLIPNFESTAETMQRLRELGVHIAIDDFGSGYSSIAYLTELPISSVKIDKSVVQQIDREAQRYRLMQSIVNLAHGQNLPTVAEGVETTAQLALLDEMQCEYTQGFLLGRPQPLDAANALLLQGD